MPSCSSGLGFFLFSSFCLVASIAFSCKKLFKQQEDHGIQSTATKKRKHKGIQQQQQQ
jgi:hypothetical protein